MGVDELQVVPIIYSTDVLAAMYGKMRARICLAFILLGVLVSAAPQCATFSPKTCMHSEKVSFNGRQCHPQECDFNADEVRYMIYKQSNSTQPTAFDTFYKAF